MSRVLLLALVLTAGCATARPLNMRDFRERGPDESTVVSVLQQLYTLQMAYQRANGRFAVDVDELRAVGWRDQRLGEWRPVMTDSGSRLCMAMLPTGASRTAYSMNGEGQFYRGPRCGR